LYDESVAVRCIAVTGVCRVLGVYWELIPEHTIRVLLAHVVNDLAHDSSSSNVRAAVVEGLRYLLDNHLSHPVLKGNSNNVCVSHNILALLPTLSTLLHDNAEKVRSEFVTLLASIKPIKSIKFYDISPVDHLLARLAIDPALAQKITELLLNSYFPHTKEASEQVISKIPEFFLIF
jgi:condensin-2 complex subunit G2